MTLYLSKKIIIILNREVHKILLADCKERPSAYFASII